MSPVKLLRAFIIHISVIVCVSMPAIGAAALPPSKAHDLEATTANVELGQIDMGNLRRQFPVVAGQPMIFATEQKLALDLNDGQWQRLADKRYLWRLGLHAPSALSLNAVFSHLVLPDSAQLYLVDQNGIAVGPAIQAQHIPASLRFYTAVVTGKRLNLELVVDEHQRDQVELQIERINQGFRDISGNRLELTDRGDNGLLGAGGCNIDVSCPEASEWQDLAASVARYTINGSGLCTGQMIAAENGVGVPYFLTANHCFGSDSEAQSLVLYFNYRSQQCRATRAGAFPGIPVNGNSDIHYGGTTLVATNPTSDFTLVRLNETPPESYDIFYTGWDRRDIDHTGGVHALHHPRGEEKRYSFTSLTAHRSFYAQDAVIESGTHLRVPSWELGTTEGGSSGSGLWNNQQRLVGQLHGGGAACGNTEPDWYGRLAVSWDGSSPSSRLRDWLDPNATEVEAIDGRSSCLQPSVNIERSAASGATSENIVFRADASGGAGGPYRVEWDTDGDNVADMNGESITLRFDRRATHGLSATVYDASECSTQISFTQEIRGPELSLSGESLESIDGGGNEAQPGSRWRATLRVSNTGDQALEDGIVSFDQALPSAGDGAFTVLDQSNDTCGYDWVSAGSGASDLNLTVSPDFSNFGANDEGLSQAISLRQSLNLFDDNLDALYLSSNGYLTSAGDDQGDDFSNDCPLPSAPDRGDGARLMPYHDDLITNQAWQQSFAQCPRPAPTGSSTQGCTVITWQEAEFFDAPGNPFAMQAIIYEDSGQIVYQYQASSASRGGGASIGVQNAAFNEAATFSCNQSALQQGNNAVCLVPQTSSDTPALLLETPSVAIPGTLMPGESTMVEVEFAVREDVACGSDLSLFAAGWAGRGAQGDSSGSALFSESVPNNCTAVSSTPAEGVSPRAGLWWNPERSGNGLDLYQVPNSNQLVVVWYTGDAQRQPTWYFAQGPLQFGRFEADLRRFTWNGSSAAAEVVGSLAMDFTDSETGLLQWQIGDNRGSERLEAFLFGVGPGSENNTGLWFDPGESGWGLTFNNQTTAAGADVETSIVYFYDNAGQPVWMLGQSEIGDSSTPMQQFGVHCPTCPWAQASGEASGTVQRSFDSLQQGNVVIDLQLQAPVQGRWQRSTTIQRLPLPL
jgi:hypothetical protein